MRRSPVHLGAGLLYVVTLLVVALWRTPVDGSLDVRGSWPVGAISSIFGISRSQGYAVVEFAANVALFAPLGWLGVALIRRAVWWHVALAGFGVSVTVEALQYLARPERYATWSDVVANTLGATLGALGAAVLLPRLRARRGRESG